MQNKSRVAVAPTKVPVANTKMAAPVKPASAKTQVAVLDAATTETKGRVRRADRPSCAASRGEMGNQDTIKVLRPYDGRGGLRANIVKAIQSAKTVWDACKIEVLDPNPGKKHSETPYTVKKVDLGFAAANGYIQVVPAK